MNEYEIVPAASVEWLDGRAGGLTRAMRRLKTGEALKLPAHRRESASRLARGAGLNVQIVVEGEFCYVRLRPEATS